MKGFDALEYHPESVGGRNGDLHNRYISLNALQYFSQKSSGNYHICVNFHHSHRFFCDNHLFHGIIFQIIGSSHLIVLFKNFKGIADKIVAGNCQGKANHRLLLSRTDSEQRLKHILYLQYSVLFSEMQQIVSDKTFRFNILKQNVLKSNMEKEKQ